MLNAQCAVCKSASAVLGVVVSRSPLQKHIADITKINVRATAVAKTILPRCKILVYYIEITKSG